MPGTKCDKCGKPIVFPKVRGKDYLIGDPCGNGDSVKVEAKCSKCGTTNTRYRDGFHTSFATGKVDKRTGLELPRSK